VSERERAREREMERAFPHLLSTRERERARESERGFPHPLSARERERERERERGREGERPAAIAGSRGFCWRWI